MEISAGIGYYDNRQNKVLGEHERSCSSVSQSDNPSGEQYANSVGKYGISAQFDDGMAASTDFVRTPSSAPLSTLFISHSREM